MFVLSFLFGAMISTTWTALVSIGLAIASYSVLGGKGKGGGSAADGSYYVSLTSESYYTDGGEPPGKWFGQGAKALGLVDRMETAGAEPDHVKG